jgi:uncharacterized membrane protein YozB (DUF420 family)
MIRKFPSAGKITVWLFALAMAAAGARYFFKSPLLISPSAAKVLLRGPIGEAFQIAAPYLYTHHRILLLTHIGCGIVALVLGLFQFVGSLRRSRPALHRTMGGLYVSATVFGGIMALPLSFMNFAPIPPAIRPLFYPLLFGLASLSIAWPVTTLMALARARQRRFDDHRAWMIRSYALTFAAVTSRIASPVLLLLTGDIVLALNVTFVSWPVNLIVAEWLIHREARRAASAAIPQVSTVTAQ